MAHQEGGSEISVTFGAAIAQGVFCQINATTGVGEVSAAGGDNALGIVLEAISAADFTAGKTTVAVQEISGGGRARILLAETVTIGDELTSDASGNAVLADTSGDITLGTADYAGASGDFITMTVNRSPVATP